MHLNIAETVYLACLCITPGPGW